MPLIIHDGDYLDCGHYVSGGFDTNKGIWWHSDDDNITKIIDLPDGVSIRESHKESDVRLKICIICGLYQDKPSDKIQLYFSRILQNVQNPSYEESN